MSLKRAFAHLNLRYNPFGRLSRDDRARLALPQFDIAEAVSHLARGGAHRAVLIQGPPGAGKTTHLELIADHIPRARSLRLRPDLEHPQTLARVRIPSHPRLIADDVDRVPQERRLRLYRKARVLLMSSSASLTKENEPGLEPFDLLRLTLRPLTPEDLLEVLNLRIEAARREEGALPTLGLELVRTLHTTYSPDIRAALDVLYDAFARLESVYDHVQL